jgi:hypothetical protein
MNDSAAARRVLRAALATDLVAFLERAFREIDPEKKLLLHPYVEFLCAELMRVAAGDERRLILNLPPRHLKSILASIVFPAFLLGRDPRLRIAVVSHSQSFARSLALPCHRTVSSGWYREVFRRRGCELTGTAPSTSKRLLAADATPLLSRPASPAAALTSSSSTILYRLMTLDRLWSASA